MQNIVVALIVLYASWYVLKRYLSRAVIARIARPTASLYTRLGWHSMAKRFAAAAVIPQKSGGCDSCSACAKEPGNISNTGNVTQKISVESLKRSLRR